MGKFKRSTSLVGKYNALVFIDDKLFSIDPKTQATYEVDLLDELHKIYSDEEFVLSTKSVSDEDVEIEDELILE